MRILFDAISNIDKKNCIEISLKRYCLTIQCKSNNDVFGLAYRFRTYVNYDIALEKLAFYLQSQIR